MTAPSQRPYTLSLGDSLDLEAIGGKAAGLGRMASAGFPVPPGFSITSEAYRTHLRLAGLDGEIRLRLADLDHSGSSSVDRVSADILGLFASSQIPSEVADQTIEAWKTLAANSDVPRASDTWDFAVSVRSSATSEDLPNASFAGQHATCLNVTGENDVLSAVSHCWASLWSVHAMTYREMQGISHLDVAMPVVVQAMVRATSSGVLFTANPVSGNPDEMMINACWGLGEAVVSGMVTPDHIVVSKHDMAVMISEIAYKQTMVAPDGGHGTISIPVPEAQRRAPALDELQLSQLCEAARSLESAYGHPLDIEFAFDGNQVHLLQARSITTL